TVIQNYHRLFREYVREKYARRPPDLVMALESGVGLFAEKALAGPLPCAKACNEGRLLHHRVRTSCGSCIDHLAAPWLGTRALCAHLGSCDGGATAGGVTLQHG